MSSRFITLTGILFDDKGISNYQLKINPFTVESFYETEIKHESAKDISTCKLITRSGWEYDIDLSIDQLEELLNKF